MAKKCENRQGDEMMIPLYTPVPGRAMRVAGFMSGSGSNLVKILERQSELDATRGGCPYRVVVIFSDNPASNAEAIGQRFSVPVVTEDIAAFYRSRGHETKKDLSLRPDFDRRVLEVLAPHHVDAVALAGYMSVVTAPLLEAFPGRIVNVHPADLTILERGKRKYTGDNAVLDAILAGETTVRSTTHIVREEVDGGEILMVSPPVAVRLPAGLSPTPPVPAQDVRKFRDIARETQEQLKAQGDWVVFPKTLERLADGRYACDEEGNIHLDGELLRDPRLEGGPSWA